MEDDYPTGENRVIKVDRSGKMTIPGSACRIKNVGIPRPPTHNNNSSNTNSSNNSSYNNNNNSSGDMEVEHEGTQITRGDLLIRFDLTDADKHGPDAAAAANIVLTSTEDVEMFVANSKKRDKVLRKFLHLLSSRKKSDLEFDN